MQLVALPPVEHACGAEKSFGTCLFTSQERCHLEGKAFVESNQWSVVPQCGTSWGDASICIYCMARGDSDHCTL